MEVNEFTAVMENHSDEKLLEVLKSRNKFQELAILAAISESISRGLIIDENDLNERFPINNESKNTKEVLIQDGFLEFKNKISNIFLVIILNICLIFFIQLPNYDKSLLAYWMPFLLSVMTFFCYKNYSKLFANIIIWITALLFVKSIISLVYLIYIAIG